MDTTTNGGGKGGIITWRSLIFGLLGIFIMSGLSGYHDNVLGGTIMIGNHMPGGAFAYFMAIGLGWNGLWVLLDRGFGCGGRLRDTMALSMRELLVVMAVTLVACFPPTSGLGRYFHRQIMLPWYYLMNKPDWAAHGILTEFLRRELFPEPWPGLGTTSQAYETVYVGFFTGMAKGAEAVSFRELPLDAWVKPMAVWAPVIFLMSLSIISLQFLVQRQWSKHEQLSYPVAQVAGSFCTISGGRRGVPDVFRNPLFWWGFVPVATLLTIHYLSMWFPQDVPKLATMMPSFKSWYLPVTTKIPVLRKVPDIWSINGQTLYFTILALAYFVSSEVSLTMGISVISLGIFGSAYYLTTGTPLEGSWIQSSRAGAYIGYTLILVYTGRTYFKAVFAKAFFLRRHPPAGHEEEDEERVSVLAARVLVLALAGFMIVLSWIFQSWVVAIFYSLLLMILFLVISRVVCETGVPFIQGNWMPGDILVRLFGPAAIGPYALPAMLWITGIFAQDPRESLMPYVATGVKAAEDGGVKLRKLFWVLVGAVGLALVIAWFSSTFFLYNFNPMSDGYASQWPVTRYFDQTARNFNMMKASGVFEASKAAGPVERLAMSRSNPMEARFFVYGMLGVMGLSVLRFRFSKFPIHPVLFLVMGTYSGNSTWGSFLAGWMIKSLVVRFGGGGVYQRLKPLFVGLIAAELFMIGLSVLIDFLYFFVHDGTPSPVKFVIMPG